MIQNTAVEIKTKQEAPHKFNRRIGSTNYLVSVNFSKTSKGTFNDKIIRLIKNDIAAKR
ncbi:MAG: transposon-encoded TnpW family protein [Oscillospiraceae bacterium]|nr:transposon-encoded TnpW family protein [Oscillospiraceae bacterium]